MVPIYRSKRGEETSEGAVADFAITSSDAATEKNSRATSDAAKLGGAIMAG